MKNVFKKLAAIGLAAAVAVTSAPYAKTTETVYAEASEDTTIRTISTVNIKSSSRTIVAYTPGKDATSTNPVVIAVIYDSDYNGTVTESNISSLSTSTTGVINVIKDSTPSESEKTYDLSSSAKTGSYTVYYKYGASTFSSYSVEVQEGPVVVSVKKETFSDGLDYTFKCTNEDVDWEAEVYDKVPSSSASSVDSWSSESTESQNNNFLVSTNNLEKNKQYYLVLKVKGSSTGVETKFAEGGQEYLSFKTKNDDSTATGYTTSSSSSSTSTTGTVSGKHTTTKDKDGNSIETWTDKSGTQTIAHRVITYTDKTVRDTVTTTDSSTGAVTVKETTTLTDSSKEIYELVTNKDKSTKATETEITSKGVESTVIASYNASGSITSAKEYTKNKSGKTTLSTTYSVGSGKKLTAKKISTTKTTLEVNDLVVASKLTYDGKNYEFSTDEVEYKVTAIGASAMKGNKKVKTILLPSSITKIGKNAFNGAKNLSDIEIDGKLTSVGKSAFKSISKKATIKIDGSAKNVKAVKKLIKKSGIAKTVKVKAL